MIDITELMKQLREQTTILMETYRGVLKERDDVIEAQAKGIKIYPQTELTYVTRVADMQREYSEMQAKLKARIAELEARLNYIENHIEARIRGHIAIADGAGSIQSGKKRRVRAAEASEILGIVRREIADAVLNGDKG